MCGICGVFNYSNSDVISENHIKAMNKQIAHRGPDESGIFIDKKIGLGHQRLTIMDLSHGQQPMSDKYKKIWLSYNGEIYNFKELREELLVLGHTFKTNCDTEVIIHAYEEYGIDCIDKFNGMFAFALWDKERDIFLLVRDRLGIKPIYYTVTNGQIIFGSEIKSIIAHPRVQKEAEKDSVLEYIFCTSIMNGKTMFKSINSLKPGNRLIIKKGNINIEEYWDIKVNKSFSNNSFDNYKKTAFDLLSNSVERRMMSDVPFGSLLSGGLDSSLVSAIASKVSPLTLSSFSFEYNQNNESNGNNSDSFYSKIMVDTLNTNHHEFIFDSENYRKIKEKATWHIEKPIELTTPSLLLLYEQLKKHITVVLSGEGADELFGGYFFFLNNVSNQAPLEFPWAPYFEEVSGLIDSKLARESNYKEKIKKDITSLWNKLDTDDSLNKTLYLFVKVYLLEMLERQDKTSMAYGVEARVPFLDHNFVNYAMNIPSTHKVKGNIEKHILKEMSRTSIPGAIVDRKKKPLPIPVDPISMIKQTRYANNLIQSGKSRISEYFNKKDTDDFFHKRGKYKGLDSLALFRTSHSMIALEQWHEVFKV